MELCSDTGSSPPFPTARRLTSNCYCRICGGKEAGERRRRMALKVARCNQADSLFRSVLATKKNKAVFETRKAKRWTTPIYAQEIFQRLKKMGVFDSPPPQKDLDKTSAIVSRASEEKWPGRLYPQEVRIAISSTRRSRSSGQREGTEVVSDDVEHAGLEAVLPELQELWALTIFRSGRSERCSGLVDYAGSVRPLPSSAAELRVGDQHVWIPVPNEPCDPTAGQAPLYLYAGRMLVMPIMRLFKRTAPTGKSPITEKNWPVEYLTLADWLRDALTRWQFKVRTREDASKGKESLSTVLDWLRRLQEAGNGSLKSGLGVVARTIGFALFGSRGGGYRDAQRTSSLSIPTCPMWLRPVEDTPLGPAVARRLVVTCRFIPPKENQVADSNRRNKGDRIPAVGVRGKKYRIRPAAIYDWGLDPVHTPEGHDIRLTGRLGLNVQIQDRRLVAANPDSLQLSVSASRIPFANYDDPRRLLMAANMQAHAVLVDGSELPLVRQDDTGQEPPGVNLRVGYLAWQGWNHEDAWVISESAARRLGCTKTKVHTIAVRAVEQPAEVRVNVGQIIQRGDLLVKRLIAPALLITSLKKLAGIASFGDIIQLRPEVGDRAELNGEVVQIERWDLRTGAGIPTDWHQPHSASAYYREVIRIHIHDALPLAAGDKLANRHGHKGVVGKILPDDEMPRWQDKPLDALIDPISVLNRSNWGQIYEALAGIAAQQRQETLNVATMTGEQVLKLPGVGQGGRSSIQPPATSGWLANEVQGVAGVQFVMRLPHHASEKISASPAEGRSLSGGLRRRRQRLGEMEHWALWAHGVPPGRALQLSPDAVSFSNVLAAAGFDLRIKGTDIVVKHLALDKMPPGDAIQLHLRWKQSAESKRASKDNGIRFSRTDPWPMPSIEIDAETGDERTVIVFDPPIPDVLTQELGKADKDGKRPRQPRSIRWIAVVPMADRPMPPPNSEVDLLTQDLRRVVRAYRRAHNRSSSKEGMQPDDLFRVRKAIQQLLRNAYVHAVGKAATGVSSSKMAMLRRRVLGQRLPQSARATAAPAGGLHLGLDEIGVPTAVARVLLETSATMSSEELSEAAAAHWIWIKRDPVLHRWGLLLVRMRILDDDNVIRLPASLLGPMNADFDGDTVALFAQLPGTAERLDCCPSALAKHDLTGEAMFVPEKQYVYGMHLLAQDASRLERFREALAQAGAPSLAGPCIAQGCAGSLGQKNG